MNLYKNEFFSELKMIWQPKDMILFTRKNKTIDFINEKHFLWMVNDLKLWQIQELKTFESIFLYSLNDIHNL